ncbi:MAG: exodeoxyribonuclease VII large subunit [Balneolaceae bacterium]
MNSDTLFTSSAQSVSELTSSIKEMLEENFMDVLVEGELSNVSRSRNGHYYFTIKDRNAQLPCVVWSRTADRFSTAPEDGQQVVLGGNIQVYPPHGRYQLIVNLLEQAGAGKLQQEFEKLKQKLHAEGLFDEAHKKPLPPYPRTIGVITSSTGAAFQDIRSTLERRWPVATILLWHASVQGTNAAPELEKGIQELARKGDVDLLIIGRGGGSLEDLWPFNEERVARAIYDCPVPVISAVGHEVDFSISDFVADVRAATPTQAAVLAVPDIQEVRMYTDELGKNLSRKLREKADRYREKVDRLSSSHALLVVADRMERSREKIRSLQEQARFRQEQRFNRLREVTRSLHHRLEKLNPNGPLERGYVRVWQKNRWVRQPQQLQTNQTFELEWNQNKRTEIRIP